MDNSNTLQQALKTYRERAATIFYNLKTNSSSSSSSTTKTNIPYERILFPALEQYLEIARAKYIQYKQTIHTDQTVQVIRKARALGSSNQPVLSIAADIRRHKWMIYLSEARHKLHNKLSSLSIPSISNYPCGIPLDIRKKYASLRKITNIIIFKRKLLSIHCKLGNIQNEYVHNIQIPCDIHKKRCEISIQNGYSSLKLNHLQSSIGLDTFESVKLLYRGKPDELYRRKNSKKYAAWKRRMIQTHQQSLRKENIAENHMLASRGYDQLLTQRSYGDTSFAPFLFQTNSHAYAYSSKITNAPKLRKHMIDKYASQPTTHSQDPLHKAQLAAETTPLFHTRVMNRFG